MLYARIAKSTPGPGFHWNADSAALTEGFIYIATQTFGVRQTSLKWISWNYMVRMLYRPVIARRWGGTAKYRQMQN